MHVFILFIFGLLFVLVVTRSRDPRFWLDEVSWNDAFKIQCFWLVMQVWCSIVRVIESVMTQLICVDGRDRWRWPCPVAPLAFGCSYFIENLTREVVKWLTWIICIKVGKEVNVFEGVHYGFDDVLVNLGHLMDDETPPKSSLINSSGAVGHGWFFFALLLFFCPFYPSFLLFGFTSSCLPPSLFRLSIGCSRCCRCCWCCCCFLCVCRRWSFIVP